jgi:hypothetical protein
MYFYSTVFFTTTGTIGKNPQPCLFIANIMNWCKNIINRIKIRNIPIQGDYHPIKQGYHPINNRMTNPGIRNYELRISEPKPMPSI